MNLKMLIIFGACVTVLYLLMHGSMKTPKVSDPVPIAVQMEELPALDQNTFFSDAHENEAAKVETEHYEDVAEEFQKVSDEDAKFFAPATD